MVRPQPLATCLLNSGLRTNSTTRTLTDVVKFNFITGLIDRFRHNITYNFQHRIDKYTTFNNETQSLQPEARYIQMDHHQ